MSGIKTKHNNDNLVDEHRLEERGETLESVLASDDISDTKRAAANDCMDMVANRLMEINWDRKLRGDDSETFVSADEPGRNDRCHCGSGEKYKYCCLTDERRRRV